MAVQHEDIVDPYIHEPKDIPQTAAGTGFIYHADGDGTGTWALPSSIYGGLYSMDSDAVTIATIGTTTKKLEAFENNSPSNGVTPAFGTDNITIVTAGDYYVLFSITFSTNAVGDAGLYQFHVRVNDVESHIGLHRQMSGSSDTGSGACHGILTLAATDVVTVWVESDEGGDTDDIIIDSVTFSTMMLKAT